MRSLLVAALGIGLVATGCADSADKFTEGRMLDSCNGTYPACAITAGCFLGNGNSYYVEGKFPGTRRVLIRTGAQAEVSAVIFLKSEAAEGNELRVTWNETNCGLSTTETVDGKAFFKEVEVNGEWRRAKNLYQPGDHIIEIHSDSTAEYIFKVETREAGQ